jgi:acetyl esterase/lipase
MLAACYKVVNYVFYKREAIMTNITCKQLMNAWVLIVLLSITNTYGQIPEHIKNIFPESTVFKQNIPYAGDTLKKHLLDIYLPANAKKNIPVVIWLHGGAWMLNDKYADMGYMKNTVRSFIEKGYALVSIDYRHSTTAVFPAQLQDCNQALQFLYDNAATYNLDKNNFALIGFSAGGHLASLLALAANNNITDFYPAKKKPTFQLKAVLDFYGPSDLLMMTALGDPEAIADPITKLLGASPLKRPDLAKAASPTTYVDKNDPPFFIVQGEKDASVPYQQSVLLKSFLDQANVKNELTIVKGAPHYGVMFDAEDIRAKLFAFLERRFNNK